MPWCSKRRWKSRNSGSRYWPWGASSTMATCREGVAALRPPTRRGTWRRNAPSSSTAPPCPASHGLGDFGAAGTLGAAEDGVEQPAAGVGVDLDEPGPSGPGGSRNPEDAGRRLPAARTRAPRRAPRPARLAARRRARWPRRPRPCGGHAGPRRRPLNRENRCGRLRPAWPEGTVAGSRASAATSACLSSETHWQPTLRVRPNRCGPAPRISARMD